ncbi:MAG: hypothetical protein QW838_01595 [Candidatus Nitrosotenuis sp.]
MTKSTLLLFVLLVGVGGNYAFATPEQDLRVITWDNSAGGGGTGMTFSVTPITGFISRIDNTGEIDFAERITVYGGDVYATNGDKISKLNLSSAGLTDPPYPLDNVEDVTGALFTSLVGIAADSNGILYVAESDDQKIYPVDLDNIPLSTPQPLLDTPFGNIQHIVIDNDTLYILDVSADAIFKIDLTQEPLKANEIYSGSSNISLSNAHSIAVSGNDIYVSGSFDFGDGSDPSIIRINGGSAYLFTSQVSDPTGLAIADGDLYVADQGVIPSSLYRFSLTDPPSPVLVVAQQLDSPYDLSILKVEELPHLAIMEIEKSANVNSVLPGGEILYKLRATNTGPSTADSIIIHDYFPNTPTGQVESVLESGNLFFTSQVNRTGIITNEGNCEREGGNIFIVICYGYGTLDVGDYIEITLKGTVNPSASGALVNRAVVDNLGVTDEDTVTTDVIESVTFSTVTKSATPPQAIAGTDSVQYTIRVANAASGSPTANNVIITDTLPAGVTSVTIQSEPSPATCSILLDNDNPSQVQCGPYTLLFNQFIDITYTVEVGSDAQNPFTNNLSVTCDQCASTQSASTTTQIIRESELSITKEADKSVVTAGADSISYTVTVVNSGPSDAANVIVTDDLPTGVSFNPEGTSPECSYLAENHRVTCNLPSLAADAQKTFIINVAVRSSATDSIINSASVSSDSSDTVTSEAVEITVDTEADIAISKTAPQNTVAGGTLLYTLHVTNSGPSNAVDVVSSDEIPTGLVFIPNSVNSQTDPDCVIDHGTVFCNFGTIAAGITKTKSFLVQIPLDLTGTIENTAQVLTETQETDPNNNTSTVSTLINPPFCGRPESDFNVIYGTSGNDHIKGTNSDDLIFGLGGDDKIHGKKGNDCIIGGDGNDKIWGGDGDDWIEGNTGNDQLHGQKGNDTLIGGDGNDKIFGGQGNDVIDAGAGDDRVHGNQGDDTINGGDGNDWIGAGTGVDIVSGGAGNDKIYGRPGTDTLSGDEGDDFIYGGEGDDTINGGDGNDKIYGHQGHDVLNGNNDDDLIHGGQGNDAIDGGNGYDRCNGAQGSNTIINCEVEDKKIKDEQEENDDDEGETEPEDDNDNHGNNGNNNNNGNKGKNK